MRSLFLPLFRKLVNSQSVSMRPYGHKSGSLLWSANIPGQLQDKRRNAALLIRTRVVLCSLLLNLLCLSNQLSKNLLLILDTRCAGGRDQVAGLVGGPLVVLSIVAGALGGGDESSARACVIAERKNIRCCRGLGLRLRLRRVDVGQGSLLLLLLGQRHALIREIGVIVAVGC